MPGPAEPFSTPMRGRTCSVEGCERKHDSNGYCNLHAERVRSTGEPGPLHSLNHLLCSVEGCENPNYAKELCRGHYERLRAYGTTEPVKRVRHMREEGEVWVEKRNGYAFIKVNGKSIKQHKYVMEQHLGRSLRPGETVHHKNGVRDDNRLENLELWSTDQPAGQRVEDKIAWAIELLMKYEVPL